MSHETQAWVDIPHVLCILEWSIQTEVMGSHIDPTTEITADQLMTWVWAKSNPEDLERPVCPS